MLRPPSFSDIDAAIAELGDKGRHTRPAKPPLKLIAEARRLLPVIEPHRERFAAMPGFDLAAIDQLPQLIEHAQQTMAGWVDSRVKRSCLAMHDARDEAISLRYRLVSAARYLLRSDAAVMRRLRNVNRQRRLPGIVGDLNRLAQLVDEHAELFASAPDLPAQPAQTARELAEKLTLGGLGDAAYFSAKDERNAAVMLLSMALQEIRCAGRFVFRYEPELLDRLADPDQRARLRRRKPKPQAA